MADKKLNIKVSTTGAKKSKGQLKGLSGSISSLGKAALATGVAYFGARGLISGLSSVIRLAGEQEKAEKKLEVALGKRSTALLKQASALQQVTTFGDEAIIGVQASLAAFLDSEDAIKKATEATLDISVAMGMDLKAAGDLIAKTLGSSTNAMSRYGVQVEGAVGSTERLESLTGNVAKLFGGQAKAQAETMAGSLEQMSNAVGDAGEAMGELLSPMVISTAKAIKTLAEGVGSVISRFKEFGKEVDAVLLDKTALSKQAIEEFRKSVKGLSEEQLLDLGSDIQEVGAKLGRFTVASSEANQKLQILETAIFAIRDQQTKLAPVLETTTKLRRNESGIIFELDSKYKEFIETQRVNFANQVAEAGMVERLIQDYPELAKAMGLVEAKSSVLGEQIELAGALSSALQTTFDPDLGAGEAFKGFVIQLMSAMQGVILASKAVSEALTFAFTGPAGVSVAIASLIALEIAKAGVRSIKFAETGFDGVVDRPTMFMTGEAGAERVQVTPLQGPNINGPQGGITLNISAPLVDETVIDSIIPAIQKAQRMNLA